MIGQLARVIVFATDVATSTDFYREVLGMTVVNDEGDFVELDAGACRLAIHRARRAAPGRTKIAFYVRDVPAAKQKLEARGAKMGKLLTSKTLTICDGQDPPGN